MFDHIHYGFVYPKGDQIKNHIYSLTTHTQIAYLSHHLPFIPLYLFHVSGNPAVNIFSSSLNCCISLSVSAPMEGTEVFLLFRQ